MYRVCLWKAGSLLLANVRELLRLAKEGVNDEVKS